MVNIMAYISAIEVIICIRVCFMTGAFCFGKSPNTQVFRASACFESHICPFYSMNCSAGGLIQVDKLQYGLRGSRNDKCQGTDMCDSGETFCCTDQLGDCLTDFNQEHALAVKNACSGFPFCGPLRAVQSRIDTPHNCDGEFSQYVVIYYNCLQDLTSPSSNNVPGADVSSKYEEGNSLPTIIGVVVAVIIVIAAVAVALIIFKRRQNMRREDDTHISDLPNGLINHAYESSKDAGESNAVVETSNYDIINDESVLTYSRPVNEKEDTRGISESAKKYGDVSADEYDKIEFEMKCAIKASNYDSVPAEEGNVGDDSYSHVSNQSKSVTTARVTTNEYTNCKLNSKDTPSNDDDYSHVDLDGDWKKYQQPDTNEEDSYNHIDFDETEHPMRSGKAVIGENKSESEKISPKCTYVKSRDIDRKNYLVNNGDTGVSSKDAQHQGIKTESLRDNSTELAPTFKDEQYTAVVKVQKEEKSNEIDGGAKENLNLKRPNVLLNTLSNSDYELAKPIDL